MCVDKREGALGHLVAYSLQPLEGQEHCHQQIPTRLRAFQGAVEGSGAMSGCVVEAYK